ncbi:MAG: hypothetical protein R3F56_17305 [Planctomycetota bacterium]
MTDFQLWLRATSVALLASLPVAAHGGGYGGGYPTPKPPPPRGGGHYTGPGDVVGGGGPGAPGPVAAGPAAAPSSPGVSGPSTLGPAPAAGPVTGGPSAPSAAPGAGPHTPRGYVVEFDPTAWSVWWGLHRDEYLGSRRRAASGRVVTGSDDFYLGGRRRDGAPPEPLGVGRGFLAAEVVPVIDRVLRDENNRDLVTACLVALAKIGIDPPSRSLQQAFLPHLASSDQEERETAALCGGIGHDPKIAFVLIDVFLDTQRGRDLVRRARVDVRTRSFAGYGLGLLAHASTEPSVGRLVVMALEQPLRDPSGQPRDVLVAAALGLGLVQVPELRQHVVAPLRAFLARDLGVGDQIAQAHAAPALAAALGRGGDPGGEVIGGLLRDLDDRTERRGHARRQSAAMALGELCRPVASEAHVSAALLRYAKEGIDRQTRYFCLVALARIGGDANRATLLQRLGAVTTIERPWVALALGLLTHGQREHAVDVTVARALLELLGTEKNEQVLGAAAIAIGLSGYRPAAEDLRALLLRYKSRDELAGHLCTALALLGDVGAVPVLRQVVADSRRRPELLVRAARALGALGDEAVIGDLTDMLKGPSQSVALLGAVGAALGQVGDRGSVRPLLRVLQDRSVPDLGRAFAAAALGGIGDKDDLPWSVPIARHVNYAAVVETLSNQVSGILDIL